ncbi:MAG: amidohydrolase family protein [Planctomycetota bacterium]
MIVDCFTHTWDSTKQLGRCLPANGRVIEFRSESKFPLDAGSSRHLAATQTATATFVLGFKSDYLDADIPNDQVAAFVAHHPNRLIGFAGIDPSRPKEAITEMRRARKELNMLGVAVAPAAQDFHPSNSQAMRVYAEACALGLPVLFHSGVHLAAATKLEYAHPILLDEVARELPDLRIVIAHLGYPWVAETIALLAKHTNVFSEISWIPQHTWDGYQALLSAYQRGVMDKLLLGSGFPYSTTSHCIEALYGINHLCHGTNLPTIPREHLRGIVERDTLALLKITDRTNPAIPPAQSLPSPDETDETI